MSNTSVPAPTGDVSPRVGIIMGSDSDWPVMVEAAAACDELGIGVSTDVVSAHRMPEEMMEYAQTARARGLEVIIAGAGGAAHLPGMVAAMTTLPVIGVPVPLPPLDGMDSLLSIVQMPTGVPVATVAIGNARNAGLLAGRILGIADQDVAKRLEKLRQEMNRAAQAKGERVRSRA